MIPFAFNPEGEDLVSTLSTLSHLIGDNMHGLDGMELGIRRVRLWRVHGGTNCLDVPDCEQASPWQMGPPTVARKVLCHPTGSHKLQTRSKTHAPAVCVCATCAYKQ